MINEYGLVFGLFCLKALSDEIKTDWEIFTLYYRAMHGDEEAEKELKEYTGLDTVEDAIEDEWEPILDALGIATDLGEEEVEEDETGEIPGESGTSSGRTFKSQYEIPTNEKGYTKSSLELGKKVHKEYMSDVADDVNKIKEYVLPSGKRVDFIDFENKIVYELKPNNPNQIRKGTKQLAGYLEEIETVFGKGWSSVLDTY